MKLIAALKPVALAGLMAVSNPVGAFAQNLIKMDNAGCTNGLASLAEVIQVQINPAAPPRKVVGKCEARTVQITASRAQVSIEIDRVQWNRNGLAPFAEQKMPDQLKMKLSGVRVMSAPERDPAWVFLANEGTAGRKFDATLAFSFQSATGALDITSASLDFHNGNTASLTAQLRGISATQPKNPELAVLTMLVDDLMVSIHGSRGRENPAMALGMAALLGKIPDGDIEAFKVKATPYIANELAAVLSGGDISALQKLVSDLPRPEGGVLLHLNAAGGFPILRLGLLAKGNKPAQALEGVSVEFGYGPDIFQ